MPRALAVLALAFVVLAPGAGWTQQGHGHRAPGDEPDPFEIQVNTFTLGNQGDPAMANNQLGDGQAIVVWSSEGQDGSGLGVYGRGIGPAGFPEFRVNSYTTGDQDDPSVAIRDFAGLYANFVVVWSSPQDGSGRGVFGQRFLANGAPAGPEFRVNTFTTGDQYHASVARLNAAGDFVVVWSSAGQDGSGTGLFGQRYSSAGAPLGTEFRVNTYTAGTQYRAAAAAVGGGAFVVAWQDGTAPAGGSPGRGIFAQRYDSAGAPLGSEFQVNSYTTGFHGSPAVTSWGNVVVVAWHSDGHDGSGLGVFAQRYDGAGAPIGSEFRVNAYTTGDQSYPAFSSHYFISWQSEGQDGSGSGIYGQLFESGFPPSTPEWRFNITTNGSQSRVSTTGHQWGSFLTWESEGQDGSGSGVYLSGETHAIPVELMQFEVE